jgi:transcription elongation factor GreA
VSKKYKLTQERLNELSDELNYLRTVREKEVAEQIKEARSFGDLSENSEYDEAKNEQGRLFSRIAELENILNNAVVISLEGDSDKVDLGCTVVVTAVGDSTERRVFTIVGSQEANPMTGRISDESPLGRALIGAKIGDEVRVEAPAGKKMYRVEDINR